MIVKSGQPDITTALHVDSAIPPNPFLLGPETRPTVTTALRVDRAIPPKPFLLGPAMTFITDEAAIMWL